ncbi:BMP family lipoprotein [Mycoplasma sp. P36-A1]|uniref:BMP family lipoprotein n=1 Tax=Mycoplasma sp. P36-A1 TaxID=3252900 RepID=UPI003C2D6068
MKKIAGLATAFALAIGLTACGGSSTADCKATSVIVTDTGGVDDKSFNQSTYEGLKRYADELGKEGACNASPIQSASAADYVPNLESVSGKDNALVVAAGYLFEDSMNDVASKNPDQKYLIVDTVVEQKNVVSAVFSAEQGSFLAGVAAAEKAVEAGKDTVGFVGGAEGPIIGAFEAGYIQGVKAVDKNIKVLSQYVGAFDKADVGKTIAAKMYDQGAYIIFQAAGQSGNGVINAAKELVQADKDVWVIGVDRDQYEDGKVGDKSVILTSMVKKVDVAAYNVSKSVLEGKFEGGKTITFDLTNDGVGLPDENPNLEKSVMDKVNELKAKVISGEIVVSPKK